jgi:hypothetical protein
MTDSMINNIVVRMLIGRGRVASRVVGRLSGMMVSRSGRARHGA